MEWRYVATDLRSGAVISDDLPITTQSFGVVKSNVGAMSASLDLSSDAAKKSRIVTRLLPRRTMLWVLGNEQPRWHGVLWDAPHSSALQSKLPLSASTPESIFQRRKLLEDMTFTASEQLDIFRSLIQYATDKPGGNIANLVMDDKVSGVARDRTYLATDRSTILELCQNLSNVDGGFEWTFVPIWYTPEILGSRLTFGYPTLGRQANKSNISFTFPGNITDYAWPLTGSRSANSITADGDAPAGQTDRLTSTQINQDELDDGYPLLEDTVSYFGSGIIDQSTLDEHASDELSARSGDTVVPSITAAVDESEPVFGTYGVGDGAYFSATSNLHPETEDGYPGLMTTVRLNGWTVSPVQPGSSDIDKVKLSLEDITDVTSFGG